MPDYSNVVSQVTSPGDAAALLLGGAAGFIVDGLASIHGFTPGTFGIAIGGATLGVKKAFDAFYGRAFAADPGLVAQSASPGRWELEQRADKARRRLAGAGFADAADVVERDAELFKDGLIDATALLTTIDGQIQLLRNPQGPLLGP